MPIVQRRLVQQIAIVRIHKAKRSLAPCLIFRTLFLRQDAGIARLGLTYGGIQIVRLASDSVLCGIDGISERFVEIKALVIDESGAGGAAE